MCGAADFVRACCGGDQERKGARACASLAGQLLHEVEHASEGKGSVVFDLLDLGRHRQQLVQMAAPPRRAVAAPELTDGAPIENRLDAAPTREPASVLRQTTSKHGPWRPVLLFTYISTYIAYLALEAQIV
jgi:hypothetical protein